MRRFVVTFTVTSKVMSEILEKLEPVELEDLEIVWDKTSLHELRDFANEVKIREVKVCEVQPREYIKSTDKPTARQLITNHLSDCKPHHVSELKKIITAAGFSPAGTSSLLVKMRGEVKKIDRGVYQLTGEAGV